MPTVPQNAHNEETKLKKDIATRVTAAVLAQTKPSLARSDAAFVFGPGEGAGGASPFVTETLPKSVLAIAQILRIPSTTAGRLGVLRTWDWFVRVKQSTHCGKTAWKVSVHAHLMTSMNAPGLKMIMVKLASTGAASAQLLISP